MKMSSTNACVKVLLFVMAGIAAPCSAAEPTFTLVGTLPGSLNSRVLGVSADGKTAVGYTDNGSGSYKAFRWRAGTGIQQITGIGTGQRAFGVSGDGEVVVGGGTYGTDQRSLGWRWTAQGGAIQLQHADESGQTAVRAISADASRAVGSSGMSWAATWDTQGEPNSLGYYQTQGNDVSGNGRVIVGCTVGQAPRRSFFWSETSGLVTLIDDVYDKGEAKGINADGSVIVGVMYATLAKRRPYRWTYETEMVELPMLGTFTNGTSTATNADGSVVGGYFDSGENLQQAFYYSTVTGMHYLKDLLKSTVPAGWTLQNVTDLSADGLTVVGIAFKDGKYQGYIATIPQGPKLPVQAERHKP